MKNQHPTNNKSEQKKVHSKRLTKANKEMQEKAHNELSKFTDEIRLSAYFLSLKHPERSANENWLEAEQLIKYKYFL